MELLLKSIAGALLATLLCLVLSKYNKESAVILSVVSCCIIAGSVANYLKPTIDFVDKLQKICALDSNILEILLKSVGIAILAEIACFICSDAGNAALGKTLQLLATTAILWLSLPLLNTLIDLIENIVLFI